jgi:hypothetical protein
MARARSIAAPSTLLLWIWALPLAAERADQKETPAGPKTHIGGSGSGPR